MAATSWTIREMPDQSGRVAIVTGANSGLGLEVASTLAGAGATVLLGCRSTANGERARESILSTHPHADVSVGVLDVSSLRTIRSFAAQILQRFTAIDLLVNNAGIMATPRQLSADGFEMQFATNHLGHFALTGLLLPAMSNRAGSRVVAVSSIAARSGRIDFDDPMGERNYDAWKAYNQSKLANLIFACELDRRLQAARLATRALAAHPGAATTNLFSTPGSYLVKRVVSPLMMRFLFHSAEAGARPILFAATAVDAVPGGYYGPSGFQEMTGPPAPARVPKQALDAETAQRLWKLSERLTGVTYPRVTRPSAAVAGRCRA